MTTKKPRSDVCNWPEADVDTNASIAPADFDAVTGEVKSVGAFNTVIDPEAAQIVLKAGFHSIVVTDLINATVAVDSALVEALKKDQNSAPIWSKMPGRTCRFGMK